MATKLGRASRKSIGGDTGEGTGFETVEVDGEWITVARRDLLEEDFEECLDPCFFEQDYTVAASTGFHIWEGCHIMIDQLIRGDLADMVRGRRVLELGAGTGLGGLCAAAVGAHVLITDVPSVVWGMLSSNIARNANQNPTATGAALGLTPTANSDGVGGSSSVAEDSSLIEAAHAGPAEPQTSAARTCGVPWPTAVKVGRGTAAAIALDWTEPVVSVGLVDPTEAEVILAAECVWLAELVPPFVATVSALLRGPNRPWCLLCYRDRADEESATFVHMEAVVTQFQTAGCTVTHMSDHTVERERDRSKATNRDKKVVMYRVTLAPE